MTAALIATIREHCRNLVPRPTNVDPQIVPLPQIRAVLFDVYGTMLISASGDIGNDSAALRSSSLMLVAEKFGLTLTVSAPRVIQQLEDCIRRHHAAAKSRGIEYPEVDIVRIWESVLTDLTDSDLNDLDVRQFAVEFEMLVNPTWPMPDLVKTLSWLRHAQRVLGIVSNAQFFTPLLFPALTGNTLDELGFDQGLSYFSYDHGQAKPGNHLYDLAKTELARRGIAAADVLYVGNDMLNDIAAASSVGFRTALFAGDERSLRWRRDDDRVHGVQADVVLTTLTQLIDCLETPA